ncbi:hypothetical protein Tco_1533304 [Tanacetum coccineum]
MGTRRSKEDDWTEVPYAPWSSNTVSIRLVPCGVKLFGTWRLQGINARAVKECLCGRHQFVDVTEADDIHEVRGSFIQIGEEEDDLNEVVDSAQQSIPKENSYDPFNIYDILNKENKDVNAAATNSSIPFPPNTYD